MWFTLDFKTLQIFDIELRKWNFVIKVNIFIWFKKFFSYICWNLHDEIHNSEVSQIKAAEIG